MNAVASAVAAAFASLRAVAGEPVMYARPGEPSRVAIPLTAVRGKSEVAVSSSSGQGASLQTAPTDFVVPAAALIAGGYGEPLAGDRVTDAAGAVYEVMPDPPYRPSDHGGTHLRIHALAVT